MKTTTKKNLVKITLHGHIYTVEGWSKFARRKVIVDANDDAAVLQAVYHGGRSQGANSLNYGDFAADYVAAIEPLTYGK